MITQKYINELTYKITGFAIEVHKKLGPGLLENFNCTNIWREGQRTFVTEKFRELPKI